MPPEIKPEVKKEPEIKKESNSKEEFEKLKKDHNTLCDTVADIGLQIQLLGRNNKIVDSPQ